MSKNKGKQTFFGEIDELDQFISMEDEEIQDFYNEESDGSSDEEEEEEEQEQLYIETDEEKKTNLSLLLNDVKEKVRCMSQYNLTSLIIAEANMINSIKRGSYYSIDFLRKYLKKLDVQSIAKFEVETYINKIKYLKKTKKNIEFGDIPGFVISSLVQYENEYIPIHKFDSFPTLLERRVFIDEKLICSI